MPDFRCVICGTEYPNEVLGPHQCRICKSYNFERLPDKKKTKADPPGSGTGGCAVALLILALVAAALAGL